MPSALSEPPLNAVARPSVSRVRNIASVGPCSTTSPSSIKKAVLTIPPGLRHTLRHDDDRIVGYQPAQQLFNRQCRLGIERRTRLIEQADLRLQPQQTSDAEPLPLLKRQPRDPHLSIALADPFERSKQIRFATARRADQPGAAPQPSLDRDLAHGLQLATPPSKAPTTTASTPPANPHHPLLLAGAGTGLIHLFRIHRDRPLPKARAGRVGRPISVDAFLLYLNHFPDRPVGTANISRAFDMSKHHLVRIVRACEPNLKIVECFELESNTSPIVAICGLKSPLRGALHSFLKSLDAYTLADVANPQQHNRFVILLNSQ